MIYFIIVTLIIVGDKFLKEYFRSSLRGKHRKEHFTKSGEKINTVDAMQDGWKRKLSPRIEFLENKGGASGIFSSHPKILKGISGAMLCFCAFVLGKERQKGRVSIAGIGYALLLGGGLSNFIDRMKKGSVTDYIRFPEFPVKKISGTVRQALLPFRFLPLQWDFFQNFRKWGFPVQMQRWMNPGCG